MTDYYLGVVPQSLEWEQRGNVRRFQSPDGGVTRTHERVGSRWAATYRWDAVGGEAAARLRSFLASQRGGANRFWAYDPSYTQRGSYSAAELLASNSMTSTGAWTAQGANGAYSASDGVLRLTRNSGAYGSVAYLGQSVSSVANSPYAMRALTTFATLAETDYGASATATGTVSTAYGDSPALQTAVIVPPDTGVTGYIDHLGAVGAGAGDYREVAFASLARCALVDNGPNLILRSDEIDNASWTKSAVTTSANAHTAPDGTATMENVDEGTGTSEHYFTQTYTRAATAEDWTISGVFVRNVGTRNVRLVVQADGANYAGCIFDLGAGTAGTPVLAGGVTNARASIVAMGNGRYACWLTARLTASTSAGASFYIINGVTQSYTGTSSSLGAWRCGAARSSVPMRVGQTTSAVTNGTAQTGGALHLKGLPVSTDGLLYGGDWVEIITPTYSELKRVTAPLNSDAAGLGYLQFEPILRQSPADNAAVIIRKPMVRMLLDESTVRTSHRGAGVMACSFTAVEDITV